MEVHVRVENLSIGYGRNELQRRVSFDVYRRDIFAIMGGSGCGKSTLMKSMIGLLPPLKGKVEYEGRDFWAFDEEQRAGLMREFGVLYQSGALWSSMTVAENVALPLREYTALRPNEVREVVSVKLALVGLGGFEDYLPSGLSGGMRKRAALARAMALDPEILFLDEPSAGLDPITSRRLDDLIALLRDSLDITVVMVSHELPSIFAIANNSVFLDADSKTMLAKGDPRMLRETADHPTLRSFLTRGSAAEHSR